MPLRQPPRMPCSTPRNAPGKSPHKPHGTSSSLVLMRSQRHQSEDAQTTAWPFCLLMCVHCTMVSLCSQHSHVTGTWLLCKGLPRSQQKPTARDSDSASPRPRLPSLCGHDEWDSQLAHQLCHTFPGILIPCRLTRAQTPAMCQDCSLGALLCQISCCMASSSF